MNRPLVAIAVALVLGLGVDLVLGYSLFPGYGASLGLVGGALLILGSKAFGSRFVQRPRDHYPDDADDEAPEDLRG